MKFPQFPGRLLRYIMLLLLSGHSFKILITSFFNSAFLKSYCLWQEFGFYFDNVAFAIP